MAKEPSTGKRERGAIAPTRSSSAPTKVISIEVTPEQEAAIEKVREETGLKSQREVLTAAFAVLTWAVDQMRNGNQIAAYNGNEDDPEIHVIKIKELDDMKLLPPPPKK